MPHIVNSGAPIEPQAQVEPAVTSAAGDNVFEKPETVPAVSEESNTPSNLEENVFSGVKEQDPNEMVPLKVFQELKAKERHKTQKQIREMQEKLNQRELALSQIQQGQVQGETQQQGYTPQQLVTYVEQQAQLKAQQQRILEIANPAYEKYDDFREVTEDLPWTSDMVLAAKDGDFIYHLSKQAPKAVLEISNASTPLEAGVLLKKYKDMWDRRNSSKSPDKKVISKTDAPPAKLTAGTPGVGAVDPKSYEAAKMRTGKYTAYRR